MSTNFYWREHDELICPCCKREYEYLHIGKSSVGWAFQLRIYPEQNINNLEDWVKLWCKSGQIFNEYGESVNITDMLSTIMARPAIAGQAIKHAESSGVECGPGTWDLVSYEFS